MLDAHLALSRPTTPAAIAQVGHDLWRGEATGLGRLPSQLLFPIESSHPGLPGGHVARASEMTTKLVTIPLDPTERDPVHLGWSVVVETHGFGDRDIVDASHLTEKLPYRVLVPDLRIGNAIAPTL